jgi:hypothetical protein
LLKADSVPKKDSGRQDVRTIPALDSGVPRLQALLCECLQSEAGTVESSEWLVGGFKPRPDLLSDFIQAYERNRSSMLQLPQDPTTDTILALISSAVDKAKAGKSHTLILIPEGPGKTAIGLRSAVEQIRQGTDTLYLLGDAFEKAAFNGLVQQIDSLHDNSPGLSVVRGMKTFLRYATRNDEESSANFFVFDNTHDATYLPVTSDLKSRYAEDLLLNVASRREWGVVFVFVTLKYGKPRRELTSWVRALAACNRHGRKWTILSPAMPDFEISPETMIQVLVQPDLQFANTPINEKSKNTEPQDSSHSYTEYRKRIRDVFLRDLQQRSLLRGDTPPSLITKEVLTENVIGSRPLIIEAAFRGLLRELPQHLLTWETIALGIESSPGSTPLRNAAKYNHLDQVPPEACAEHYHEAKSIVMAAVEASQNFGRAERWAIARKWLLKVILLGSNTNADPLHQAKAEIQAIVQEAIRSGSVVRIGRDFKPLAQADLDEGEDEIIHWLRKYMETKVEDFLDFALTVGYLAEILPSDCELQEQDVSRDLFIPPVDEPF